MSKGEAQANAAEAACRADGFVGLCSKGRLEVNGDAFSLLFAVRPLTRKQSRLQGHSACGFGWCSDWEGYWIEKAQTGCGDAGYNAHTGPAGAWCCNPPAGRAVVLSLIHI